MFLTGDNYEMGKSKRFTIRTTERQQPCASLARPTDALRRRQDYGHRDHDTWSSDRGTVDLSFDKLTSLKFTKELLTREFKKLRAPIAGRIPTN